MGILDFLQKILDPSAAPESAAAGQPSKPEAKPSEPPAISEEDAERWAEAAAERVIQETRIPLLRIELLEEPFSLFASHTGGLPYLPRGCAFPTDGAGQPMYFLAQINCEDLCALPDYPHEGILQFWLCDQWEEAKVTYHREIDWSVTEDDVRSRCPQRTGDEFCSPLGMSCRMKFTPDEESMSGCDPRQMALYTQYYSELSGERITSPWDSVQKDIVDTGYVCLCDEDLGSGHKVGGYRYSTQFWRGNRYDPARPVDLNADDAPMLLFQLDSDYTYDYDNRCDKVIKVLWGDAGVGHFLINRADLLAGRYEEAWFYWDCS
ncbi:MAG: DUF1963 domain-containing protein [Oscillospiraceae bacterium]|nr:DUF1963 domain-containing protein [Oscillospiraceae bacterium]